MSQRTLSESDVLAIVDALELRLTDKFYHDLGKGLWAVIFKAIMGALMFIAAYGAVRYGAKM